VENVLVVDDEESVRRLLRDCLELEGYRVREAADALQAMERIKECLPDCVVLDVMMPGMSGIELLEHLRDDASTAHLPVLLLTAATDDATTWAGWANGVSCYMPKPFDIDHLLDWVDRLCAPEQGPPSDPAAFDLDPPAVALPAARPRPSCAPAPAPARPLVAPSEMSIDLLGELSSLYDWPASQATDWPVGHDGPQAEELARALDTGQIWVAYQPIVALSTEHVVGVEALARWAHPHRGDLMPQEFLPLSERHGLESRLDDRVLRDAVQQVSEWNAVRAGAGLPGLTLSINVSPNQVAHPSFCATLRTVLQTHDMSPVSLVLELTEVALMRLLAGDQRQVRDLLELGVSLAFDDFSAAATSLTFLQRFHVDVVKVDRSLVRGLGVAGKDGDGNDTEGDGAVAAVISIAHRLGRAVVAEGVETMEQAARLLELGCEYAQGYYFGFPGSAAQMGQRLVHTGE
jgi:EAL domain-containing protein (putative c-di-GMP-specific phosphodiesterase class I)/ActR/RegA family two-component response regulator